MDDPRAPGSGADAELVRAFLGARDVPCPRCGYNLRGIPEPRCPECEREVSLCVEGSLVPPRVRREALVLLWAILLGLVGQVATWLFSGIASSGMPAWYLAATFVILGAHVVECAVLLRLIIALGRPAAAAAADRRVLRRSVAWLAAHAAVVCLSVALGLLFLWLF